MIYSSIISGNVSRVVLSVCKLGGTMMTIRMKLMGSKDLFAKPYFTVKYYDTYS